MTTPDYDSFAIFPALNVARIGNATEKDGDDYYYVCSEIPRVYVGKGDPSFNFKINGKVKPQAARFRIYGYKNGENKGEIRPGKDVEIKWTVVLANKKAAHMGFFGKEQQDQKGPIRNSDWPYERSTLMAVKEGSLTSESGPSSVELTGRVYRNDKDEGGRELYLGKIIMEKEGSLLIIGGKGESGSIRETFITNYANNDYWYDDTSDGSVDATVIIKSNGIKKALANREGSSWVLVAPPKFAPGIPNIVPLYQTILETQKNVVPENPVIDPVIPERERKEVQYYRDIRPIFETICKNSWVNDMAQRGHGLGKPGYFLNPVLEEKLCDNGDNNKDLRKTVLSRVRVPADLASSFEYNGQAFDYFMPPLSGDGGDANPGSPDSYLTVTRGQYFLLQKWADGQFVPGVKLPEYRYNNKVKGDDSRKPTYLKDDGKTYSFQEMCPSLSQQVKILNKAVLVWCVGGPFFPGIEMTYLAYNKNTFSADFDFRINPGAFGPGDINAYMALPWQADFNECNTHWWPAQRPDVTIPEEKIEEMNFVNWTRGFRNDVQTSDTPQWGDMDMVRVWNRLGFVVERKIPNRDENAFVEVERGKIYDLSSDNIAPDFYTLDNLHSLLNIALQVELSTIPPYLYAMYSIKPKNNIGDIADMITYKIRHVAAEEMLHTSLVANLIAAIGRRPVFYSPDVIPFYPNPLPHFRQGLLMVHLSKANENNFDTFIEIEEPYTPPVRSPPPDAPDPDLPGDLPISFNSIGELYHLIRKFFDKLDKKGVIPYDTQFQLETGMGYAPSTVTGRDGLIVVKDISEADRAIDLIIDQGEGKPSQADMEITKGNIVGVISGETRVKEGETQVEGIIKGDIEGTVKKNGSEEIGTIKGKIEKARIQGKIVNDPKLGTVIYGTIVEGIIEGITNFKSEGDRTIERIIERGRFTLIIENIGEGIKFEKSIKVLYTNGNIEESSHYNTFRICKIYVKYASESEYQLWPVIDDPNVSSYTDPKIVAAAKAFDAAYSYLMILLQNAWRTNKKEEKEKKELVIGGMPALMHGVLKPIATFLAEKSISADTNAGATFGYYVYTSKSNLRNQLIGAIQGATSANPDSDKLAAVTNVVNSLPDVSLTI